MKTKLLIAVAALVVGPSLATYAVNINYGGLTWSEVSPDVVLHSVTGSGTVADPFFLTETVSGPDVTISIAGMGSNFGQLGGTTHVANFRLTKYILNATAGPWTFYDNELQEILGTASTDGDGLAFGQGGGAIRTPVGNPLSTAVEIDTWRDYINFSGGTVDVGEYLTVTYTISDNSPDGQFYLRQRPNIDYQENPVPDAGTTVSLLGLALASLGVLRRKMA